MKKVLIFGSFDGIHPGHESLFRQARGYGDYLVVILARDSTIQRVKHRKPVDDENRRLVALQDNPLVDEAILGVEDDPVLDRDKRYAKIKEIKPDVICLGYDQEVFTDGLEDFLKRHGLSTKIVRLESFKPEIYKSSLLRKESGGG